VKKKTFFILCLEGAVLSFNIAAAAALVPSIAKDFALSQFFVGRLIWMYMLPYGVAALFYGPLVRVMDAKRVELFCIFFFSLANLLAALAKNIYILFAARFFMGVFGASVIPLALILIAKGIEAKQRGKLVGIFFSATFVASLLGLSLSGILHWRAIFLIPAISGLILCLHMYWWMPSFKTSEKRFRMDYLAAFRNKAFLNIFAYIFFISLIYHGLQQWLAVYFSSKFNLGQFMISMLITLTSLSGVFGEVLGGWFSDTIGRLKTVNLGIIFMIISAFALIFKAPIVLLVLIVIIWGLGWTINHAGISTMLTDLPVESLNEAASLNSGVRFISGGLGVALGGIFIQQSFGLNFVLFGTGLVFLFLFAKRLLKLN